MELPDGITLREELRAQKRLSASRTVQLFEAICAGVGAAHLRGLVHRDLKPENIFLVRAGTPEFVKTTDLGIAKFLPQVSEDTSSTLTDVFIGSLPYMSPEQLRGGSLSPRWDLWALSVIAFETLCGVQPFIGSDFPFLQNAILKGASARSPCFSATLPPGRTSSIVPWHVRKTTVLSRSPNSGLTSSPVFLLRNPEVTALCLSIVIMQSVEVISKVSMSPSVPLNSKTWSNLKSLCCLRKPG